MSCLEVADYINSCKNLHL